MKRPISVFLAILFLLGCSPAANAAGLAPVAENLSCETYRNVPVSGLLEAIDPEGESVSFCIVREPSKGTVVVQEDGTFLYTPLDNKKGRDSFTYTAVDTEGNRSEEATVSISISRRRLSLTYGDMTENEHEYEALCLAENGLFVGERIGETAFFCPEAEVTRGEFLAMCMTVCGDTKAGAFSSSGFADDGEMASWVRPYVAAAAMAGLVKGYEQEEGNAVFAAESPITEAEASVLMSRVLEISDVSLKEENAFAPAWAEQAMTNLSVCGIPVTSTGSEALTREKAAVLLVGAMKIWNQRSDHTLSWQS